MSQTANAASGSLSAGGRRLLRRLTRARRAGWRLGAVDATSLPSDIEEAYRVAAALLEALATGMAGCKIGAASEKAQRALGLHQPFWGPLRATRIFEGAIALEPKRAPYEVEPEIAFRLKRANEPGRGYSREEALELFAGAFVAMEINRPSFRDPFAAGALALISDLGANEGTLLGAPIPNWRKLDLSTYEVRLETSAGLVIAGTAGASGFDPLALATWALGAAPLKAGDVILTGGIAGFSRLRPGESARLVQSGKATAEARINPA